MSTIEDTEQASECLDHLQTMLWEVGDHSQDDEISSLICMLQSPLFRQLLVLQDSIQELEQVHDTHGLQNYDYSFMPELRLETKAESGSQEEMIPSNNHRVNSMPSYQQAAAKVIDSVAHGREVETIKMFKPEKQSLGFSVVTHAEGGIFVQDIQPGGIADRHGNLRERDQILSIDGQPLDISHQEAIKILQRAGGLVELVVARGPIPHGETPADTQDLTTQPSADTTDMLSTEWTQIEVIDLINDGTGLGFGIIGGRSTGVVVKTILPGGVADVDERLHSGDHILQIGEVNVRGMGSEQVAAVLRQSGSHVRLIVARPIHEPPAVPVQHAPIVPTAQLDEHLEQINSFIEKQDQMMLDGQANEKEQIALYKQQQLQKSIVEKVQVHNPPVFGEEPPPEYPEVQYYDVTLAKDAEHGLGITIAGYVGRDNTPGTDDLCGIFVNSITKGSAADKDGQIQVNDQIIEVDGQALQGLSNHDAVEILRKNGQVVKLKLARYQHGDKFDKLQQYLAQPQPHPLLPINGQPSFGNEVIDQTQQTPGLDTEDIAILEDLDGEILPDVEAGIKACWEPIVGEDFEIVVSQLSKFREGGGLGISLEGTVDVENGVEVRPHHYIRAILPQGPVGINGRLCSGDELLEVNGKRLLGLNHKEVVGILKELPQNVRLVCARKKLKPNEASEEETGFQTPPLNSGVSEFAPERLVKSKSDNAISTESNAQTTNLPGKKSRSLEMLANLAMWSSEPVMIELTKADRGLGFSILDYQDPVNPNDTVIVIKSLVPGGVAQMDGRLVPGDRLMFVNEVNLENATLDEAVQALKGAQKGLVRIGVAKPLPLSGPFQEDSLTESEEEGPPPLPFTSPPPLQPLDDDTKSSTSNTSTTPVSVKENPLSRIGMVSPGSDVRSDQLDTSSSSDQFNQSDLKVVQTSPTSSPRTTSPGISPISSPSLMRSFSGPDALPPSLEKKITLKRSDNNLGITVEASDKGINGCIVKSLAKTGAIYKHGQIQVGDHIMSINNESMRRITNTQARVILRRASLMGTADITLTYVTAADADAHKEAVARRQQDSPSTPTMMPSPKIFPKHYRSTLSPLHKPSSTSDGSAQSSPLSSPHKTSSPTRVSTSPAKTTPQASPRQKETVVVGSGNQTWGPPRLVELYREPGKTLGISIVGGRVDMYHVAEEHVISGIFIKHVLEDSPAGRNGTLKTGDRILQVDGKDLRNATHDQAVDTIRNASNPVKFVVQSLVDPACPKDLDTDIKSVHSYDEGLQKLQAVAASNSNSDKVVVEPVLTQALAPPVETLPPPEPEPEPEEEPEEEDEPEDEFGYSNQRIQRRYGELNGDLLLVDLKRGTSGLGISLAGNKDRNTMSVFVAGIQPQSAAALDGRIQVGDELLEVNGNVLYGRSHLNASAIIKGIDAKIIKFVLLRRDDNLDRMAVKPLKVSTPVSIKQVEKPAVQQSEPATLTPVQAEEKRVPSPTTPSTHDVIQSISLSKGPSGLGFAIVEELREGTQGIYVRSITYGGVADKDGQLSVGDQILEVQDKSLTNVHYDKAIEILRNSQGNVRLKVRKCSPDGSSYTPNNVQGQEKITFKSMPGESSTDGPASQLSPEGHPVDPLTCPIIPGQETQIFIEKGRTGLGLSIVGGADTLLGAIIIHEVYEDGAAARDGRLWAGDQVLEVNNENLREATHDYAIQVLRQTPATVQMLVFRDDAHVKEEDIYDIFTVELIKKPGKGLGLSIVGKRNDVGVYISDIVKGGAAESDARLMQGDQILAVNGEDMRNATQEYAAAVLKTTMGKVTLTVGRLKAGSRTSSRKNSNSHGTALKKSESTASNKSKGGRHSKKGSEDMSHIRTVELEHDTNGSLGLSIAGGIGSPLGDTPILVANLTPGGSAERSRKLKVGDKILSINGVNTDGMNHDQVIQILKSSRGSITLQVTQGEQTQVSVSGRTSSTKGLQPDVQTRNMPLENNVFDDGEDGPPPQCKTITLERGQDGLGFSIVGGHASPHGDLPIYVKNVFSKGAAADNGQLKRGDQILTVNGTSLEGLTHEEAVNILKNAKGSVIMSVLS